MYVTVVLRNGWTCNCPQVDRSIPARMSTRQALVAAAAHVDAADTPHQLTKARGVR